MKQLTELSYNEVNFINGCGLARNMEIGAFLGFGIGTTATLITISPVLGASLVLTLLDYGFEDILISSIALGLVAGAFSGAAGAVLGGAATMCGKSCKAKHPNT